MSAVLVALLADRYKLTNSETNHERRVTKTLSYPNTRLSLYRLQLARDIDRLLGDDPGPGFLARYPA